MRKQTKRFVHRLIEQYHDEIKKVEHLNKKKEYDSYVEIFRIEFQDFVLDIDGYMVNIMFKDPNKKGFMTFDFKTVEEYLRENVKTKKKIARENITNYTLECMNKWANFDPTVLRYGVDEMIIDELLKYINDSDIANTVRNSQKKAMGISRYEKLNKFERG